MPKEPQELLRVAGIARHRGVTPMQASNNLKAYPLEPDFISGTVRLWEPKKVAKWASKLPKTGQAKSRSADEIEAERARVEREANPEELWRVIDIARYRGVTKVQAHYNLEHYPLEPDYFAGDYRFWRPDRVKKWAATLPTKGKYPRKKNSPK